MLRRNPPKMRINVCSLDFDGCMFNSNYIKGYRSGVDDILLDANQEFLATLIKRIKTEAYKKIFLMVGSNRQCYRDDKYASTKNNTESCFLALEKIHAEMEQQLQSHIDCKQ